MSARKWVHAGGAAERSPVCVECYGSRMDTLPTSGPMMDITEPWWVLGVPCMHFEGDHVEVRRRDSGFE